jgi:uncharacterized protein (DUF885 family)
MSESNGPTSAPADSDDQEWFYLTTTMQPEVVVKADRAEYTDLSRDGLVANKNTADDYQAYLDRVEANKQAAEQEAAERQAGVDEGLILRDDGTKVGEPDTQQLQRDAERAAATDGDELLLADGQQDIPPLSEEFSDMPEDKASTKVWEKYAKDHDVEPGATKQETIDAVKAKAAGPTDS